MTGFANGDNSTILTGTLSRTAGENVGNYEITPGTISAGENYSIVFAGTTFEIIKADQVITWSQNLEFGCDTADSAELTAYSTSGLPISYTLADPALGVIEGTKLTITNSGNSVISAAQDGNENYNPATTVINTVSVSQSGLIVQHWSDALFSDNKNKNFVAWQWYKNGSVIVNATHQYYSENQALNGTYYLIATDNNGKSIKSCPIVLTGTVYAKSLKVFPNPARALNEFILECDFSESQLNGATITVFNITGTLVQTISNVKAQNKITAPSQSGVYIVMLSLTSGKHKTINVLVN